MEAKLTVVKGKSNRSQMVVRLPAVLGRSRDVDFTVAHPMVSRRHCELFEADGQASVRDLGSLNGTYVNGERVREASLPAGTQLTVGPLTFRIDYPAPGSADEEVPDFAFDEVEAEAGPEPTVSLNPSGPAADQDEDSQFAALFGEDDEVTE